MDRRKFFKIAAGTVAAASVSNILRAQTSTDILYTMYYTDTALRKYTATFHRSAIKEFGAADREKKVISLEISHTDSSGNKLTGKYQSVLTSSELMENSTTVYRLKGKEMKLVEGTDVLPSDFPRRLNYRIYITDYSSSYDYCIIDKEDGTEYMKLAPPPAATYDDDEYYGCFLTTACVENKGLADNCYELETLRHFRDTYMRNRAEGSKLVDDYYKMGPGVVRKINSLESRSAIYDHIYDTLILPCLGMIERKEYPATMEYYRDYVVELHRQLS